MRIIESFFAATASILLPDSANSLLQSARKTAVKSKACSEFFIGSALISALVIAEDRRFWKHGGVDIISIASLPWRFVRERTISGASTIEQQLVRSLTGRSQRSLARKLREMCLACVLDEHFDKVDLARMYLSVAYFGWRMNGIEEACKRRSLNLENLTDFEAASLVARLRYPEPRLPTQDYARRISTRAGYILRFSRRVGRTGGGDLLNASVLDV